MGSGPLEGKRRMPVLYLHELVCHDVQDRGEDECQLEIATDGPAGGRYAYNKDMDVGDRWPINKTHPFLSKATIKLWDKDSTDPDDLIDQHTIGSRSRDHARLSFAGHNAKYTLSYSVKWEQVPVPGTQG